MNKYTALSGLQTGINRRENANNELNSLERLYTLKKNEELEEQKAALAEQEYYKQIREKADKLLVNDRAKVNEKALSIQRDVRDYIKSFGGSRAKFMANGGMALMGSYSSKVLDSPEMKRYENNHANLIKLYDLQEKGLGHLIVPRDKANLDNYNKYQTGDLTYSGVMQDIVIPPSDLFESGKIISASDIMQYDQNKMKLISNYNLEYPDRRPLIGDTREDMIELYNYVVLKGYTGIGSDKTKMQLEYSKKSRETSENKEDKKPEYIHTEAGVIDLLINKNELIDINGATQNSILTSELANNLYGNTDDVPFTFTTQSPMTMLGTATNNIVSLFGNTDTVYRPRGARSVFRGNEVQVFKSLNPDKYLLEGNTIKDFDPTNASSAYYGDGSMISAETSKWSGNEKGDYEILTSFIGLKMKTKEGTSIVMDAIDDNGKYNAERSAELYDNVEDKKGKPSLFFLLKKKGETGQNVNSVYLEVPAYGAIQATKINGDLGAKADLSKATLEGQQKNEIYNDASEQQYVELNSEPKIGYQREEFNNGLFKNQVEEFNIYGTNKSNFMKSYYMASLQTKGPSNYNLNAAIEANTFKAVFEHLGIDYLLKDKYTPNSRILTALEDALNKGETNPEYIRNNKVFVATMIKYLDIIK